MAQWFTIIVQVGVTLLLYNRINIRTGVTHRHFFCGKRMKLIVVSTNKNRRFPRSVNADMPRLHTVYIQRSCLVGLVVDMDGHRASSRFQYSQKNADLAGDNMYVYCGLLKTTVYFSGNSLTGPDCYWRHSEEISVVVCFHVTPTPPPGR